MIIKIRIALIALLLVSAPASFAHAGSFDLVINGWSHHVNSDYDWNESNYGIGIEYEFNTESRWIRTAQANGFRDSESNMSYMVGAGLHRRLLSTERLAGFYIDAGLGVFLMTREDIDDNRPFPGLLPSMRIGNRYVGLNLSYIPKAVVHDFAKANVVDPNIDGVFFLQFKIRLDRLLSN